MYDAWSAFRLDAASARNAVPHIAQSSTCPPFRGAHEQQQPHHSLPSDQDRHHICHERPVQISIPLPRATLDIQSFICDCNGCGRTFGRLDTLKRHLLIHQGSGKSYSCPHCPKYQEDGAFRRKDHLTQHMRQFHRIFCDGQGGQNYICLHDDCKLARTHSPDHSAFDTTAELYKHIRRTHKDTPYQCSIEGCQRINAGGWFRAHDRNVHQRAVHSEIGADVLVLMNGIMDAMQPEYLLRKY